MSITAAQGAQARQASMSAPSDRKPLGFLSLLTLGINGTIGVGIFFAPAEVAAQTSGYSGALVFLLAGVALLPVAFIYSHLGGRFAEDGGPYVWARLAFGPQIAFLIGFLTYISSLLSTATVATGLSQHLRTAFGPGVGPDQKTLAVLAVLALSLTAATGLRLSSLAWNGVTLLKLLPLIMLSAVGVYAIASGTPAAIPSAAASQQHELGRALLIVVFALQGFEIVPVLAGSAHSGSAVPWATLGTLVICMLFYCGLHALCVYALPDLAAQKAPLVGAAAVLGGPVYAQIVSIGQIISAIGIAFGQCVTTPRYLATLGRTDALGEWIGAEDTRRVPQRALWITTIGVIVCVLREDLGSLFALSSIAVLAQYTVATLALTVLAQRGAHGVARGQRYWVLPALIGIALVARGAEARELLTTAAVTALGAIILLARRGSKKPVPRS